MIVQEFGDSWVACTDYPNVCTGIHNPLSPGNDASEGDVFALQGMERTTGIVKIWMIQCIYPIALRAALRTRYFPFFGFLPLRPLDPLPSPLPDCFGCFWRSAEKAAGIKD